MAVVGGEVWNAGTGTPCGFARVKLATGATEAGFTAVSLCEGLADDGDGDLLALSWPQTVHLVTTARTVLGTVVLATSEGLTGLDVGPGPVPVALERLSAE